jgi:diguanylate cyclase (GGDEF)-like protein
MPVFPASLRRFACAALLLLAQLASAQTSRTGLVSFRRLAIPDNVPAHLCSAIAQDRSGLLWFGTQRGLVRYDGYDFRVYRSNPADPKTLGGNYVRSLLVASDGRLWVGTFSGRLSVFDPKTETFTRFDQSALGYDRVEGLAEDRSGAIWIATTAGLDRLDPRSGKVQHFRHDANDPRTIADDRVRGLLVDRGGRLWVGTRDGVQRLAADGRGFERVAPGLAGQFATRIYEDRLGRIWVGTERDGAAVIDPRDGSVRHFAPQPADPNGLSHYWVYGFAETGGGELWVATFGGGVDVIDERSLTIVDRLKHDPVLADTIGTDRVGAVFRDRSGLMWVGSWGEGMAYHDPRTRGFRSLRASPNRPGGLTHPAIVRSLEVDGTIWAGTNGNGIDLLDRDLQLAGGFRPDANDPGALSDGAITCIERASDGAVWVATLNGALHRLRRGATRFERVPIERLAGGPIRAIAFDASGFVWSGASQGMTRIDPRDLTSRIYRRWPGAAANSSPAIEAIVVARDGTLWVGSDNGLYAFDPRTESAVRIAKDPSRADGLPENWVPDLLLGRDGRLWAGTSGGAVVMTSWDGKTARFRAVPNGGHAPAPAEALIEDDAGNMWIGPRLRVDPRSWTATELGPLDGVAFRNFFIASRARTASGQLLFGSPEGLLVVDPRAAGAARPEAAIVATSLRVEGKSRPGAAIAPALRLSSAERSFALDVATLDTTAAPRAIYRHRLEGLERDWTVMAPSQHSLTYSRLPPGRFTLRVGVGVGGGEASGRWSAQELRLPVVVEPAIHQTAWARVLMALFALAVIYGAYRLRVRQLRARERALEQLVTVRTSELAEKNRQLEGAYSQIEEASLTDPLTSLRNRRFLEQTIPADLEIAARGDGRDLVILLVDLDHFKSVNDLHGHAAGDAVLVELAQRLQHLFRTSDCIVRWGGEEFLIVVRFVDRAHAADLAEKLRAAVAAEPFTLPDGKLLRRTCSVGAASWPFSHAAPRALPWERVVAIADAALYAAKRGGRDAWVVATIAEGDDPAAAADAFTRDPEAAIEAGVVSAQTSAALHEV